MEAIHKSLLEFMGNKNHFIIPKYQRNYTWGKVQCERLFDDIKNIHTQGLKTYFLGASVVVSEKANELILIDGQQRMTSISLLLLATCNLLKDKRITSQDAFLSDTIWEDYLINKRSTEKSQYIRLKQVNQDSTAYENLFIHEQDAKYDSSPELKQTAIYNNYKIFEQKVFAFCKEYSIDDLWQAIEKLQIVQIELKVERDGDKPQVVFETINSTGKELEDADLIRNYILMERDKETQDLWFEQYWQPIEKNTLFTQKGKQVSYTTHAIANYLMYQQEGVFDEKDVYKKFREYIYKLGNNEQSIESFLNKLLRFSKYYRWFAFKCDEHPKLERYFYEFRLLSQKTTYSYFMDLMDLYETEKLTLETVCSALNFILQYYVRRSTIGLSTNVYRPLYPTLKTRINTQNDTEYLNALYGVFANFAYRDRYPDNQEIRNELLHRPFFKLSNRLKKMVLEKLCNYNSNEKIVIDNNITIEHIMPQTLTEKWKKELGDNWQDIHDTYLHTIGNLTLTGYNSKHSNKPFTDKKDLIKEYSNIPLNKYFENIEDWGKPEIYNRCIYMIDLFNTVFPDISNRSEYRNADSGYLSRNKTGTWYLGEESQKISEVAESIKKIYFDDQLPEKIIITPIKPVLTYILYNLYTKSQYEFLNTIHYNSSQKDFITEFYILFNEKEFEDYNQFYGFYRENNPYTMYKQKYTTKQGDPSVFTTHEADTLCKKIIKEFQNQSIIFGDIKLEYIPK